jgi:hypothetical protein
MFRTNTSESLDLSNTTPSRSLTAVSSSNSSDDVSPQQDGPSTPKTLRDHFQTSPPTRKRPSPPHKNMEMSELHARMQSLIAVSPSLFERVYPALYDKLSYAIGHDLDMQFARFRGMWYTALLLNENTAVGKRYEALYSADGDEMSEKSKAVEKGIESFDEYTTNHLPEYKENNEDVFVVFHDPDHSNMEPFYRVQLSGNCYIQAAILVHWYLNLWYDKEKKAENVRLIHLSKFVRNRMTGKELYDYIFNDTGGDSRDILPAIAGFPKRQTQPHDADYAVIRESLEKYGPGLAIMTYTHEDFHEANKFRYEGTPDGKAEGHAVVLVGIRKNDYNETYFLLQNFWEGKQFVEVRQDYFIHSSQEASFDFIVEKFDEVDAADVYSQKTGSMRIAQSSPLLERSIQKSCQR